MAPGRDSTAGGRDTTLLVHAMAVTLIALGVVVLYHGLLTRHPLQVHDSLDSYLRADGYLRELDAGHVPPQLFAGAISGGGYALPRFYPPLGYLVAAALAALTGDLVLGVHLALLLSVVASGWAMYHFGRGITGRAAGGALAALLYVTFPYRFTDVLQRSAVAESWTFVWFPLLFAGAWQAIRQGRVPWYFALSVAGLLLTHTTTALYFTVVCAAIALLARRQVTREVIQRLGVETLIGAALAAWFLLPQAWYLPGVRAGDPRFMWATPDHADANRLTVDLLVHRFAAPNGLDLGLGLLGAALPVIALLRWRQRAAPTELDPRIVRVGYALALTWVGCIAFMMAPLPALLVLPTPFAYIQFPWRLLGIAGFLAATSVTVMAAGLGRNAQTVAALLAAAALAAAALPSGHRRVAMMPEWGSAQIAAIGQGSYGRLGYTILGEYLPRGDSADSINVRIQRGPAGGSGVRPLAWRPAADGWFAAAEVDGATGELVLPLVGYDMYRVLNQRGEPLTSSSVGGLLAVRLPRGRHELRISRRRTGVELAGIGISIVALLGFVALRRR